ncbi:MAG: DUF5063 domain-containing protein [Dysgonomonas sp.]
MADNINSIVYSKDAVEFVAVAVQYCNFLENIDDSNSEQLTDRLVKILPLLYLKANLLPETIMLQDSETEQIVTEDHYNYILSGIYGVYGKDDTYLEVFLQDMKYSETPISASISEDLTDIYQDVKNFLFVYEQGIEENMNDALFVCTENFKLFWGQKLVNVLRALHSLKYQPETDYMDEDINNIDEQW